VQRKALDQSGVTVFLTEFTTSIPLGSLDDGGATMRGLSSLRGPDGENLTPDGDGWFRGIHSGKRYKLAD